MEFEQMIRIIETVSNSSLTAFHYEANGVKIDMEREAGAAPAGVSPVAAGNVTAGAAAALPAAGTAAAAETTVPGRFRTGRNAGGSFRGSSGFTGGSGSGCFCGSRYRSGRDSSG